MRLDTKLTRSNFPPLLTRFWIAVVAMTALAAIYSLVMQRVLGSPTPYGLTSLSMFGMRDWDFNVFQDRFLIFRKPGFWAPMDYPFTYPAPAGVAFGLLYKLPHPLRMYLSLLCAGLAFWAWCVARTLAARGISRALAWAFALTVLVTAWPVIELLGMGNIEGLMAIILAAGVWSVFRERWWLGATLIALAGTMKFYPFVLLGLLLSKRRYKEFAWAVVAAALITVASLAILGPTIGEAQQHIGAGLIFVKQQLALRLWLPGLQFNHSLFEIVKWAVVGIDRASHPFAGPIATPLGMPRTPHEAREVELTFRAYTIVTAAFGVVLYFWRIRPLPMLNQLFALTVCGVLLPPLSSDYTLVQLLLPLGLLCIYATDQWRHGLSTPGLALCFGCIAVLFTVGTYFKLQYQMSSQVRTVALIVLLIATLRYPMRWHELDGEEA